MPRLRCLSLKVIKFAREDNNVGEISSLVDDAPLGARLLVAMANGYRHRLENAAYYDLGTLNVYRAGVYRLWQYT